MTCDNYICYIYLTEIYLYLSIPCSRFLHQIQSRTRRGWRAAAGARGSRTSASRPRVSTPASGGSRVMLSSFTDPGPGLQTVPPRPAHRGPHHGRPVREEPHLGLVSGHAPRPRPRQPRRPPGLHRQQRRQQCHDLAHHLAGIA